MFSPAVKQIHGESCGDTNLVPATSKPWLWLVRDGFPEASKFWREFSHRDPEQGLDPTQGDGNRQQMQEHPCPASLMRDG